jgi:eukaryotic-like serine/threonine-protein kinase
MPIHLAEHSVVAGRFRLNHPIGRGGMGSVWHATHLGLDVPCAVKFIEGEYAAVADAQARFEREAKAAAALRSPHVVQILDHGVCEGTPYIAMELLDGEDLGKRLQRVGQLPPRDAFAVISQVCRALTKAHGLGIVHRDLKPDNIFLVRDDDREIAKVLDFGIAKRDHNALGGSSTKTGAMLGTPYYMSPEQAQGTRSVDFRSDLWSLAVIVYQCVTGALPFESEALGDLLVKIIVNPLPVPSRCADVPYGFDAWWSKAASREPGARFQSAKEFADSLGLVFGVSQASGVIDRGQVSAAQRSGPGPLGLTPTPAGLGTAPANPLASLTGGPLVRTYLDDDTNARLPKRAVPMAILFSAVGFLAVAAIAGVMLASRGKAAVSSASAPPVAVPVATQSAAVPPPVVLAIDKALVAPPSEPSALEPAAKPPARAAPTGEASKPAHSQKAAAKPPVPSAKPAGPATSPRDLGF